MKQVMRLDWWHAPLQNFTRRYIAWLRGMGLFVVVGACNARHTQTQWVSDTSADASEQPDEANAADSKGTATPGRNLRNKPLGLIYRQAGDAARQRLTAENARTRLDELDTQIEREKEINQ